jgi:hypothetical protein
MRIRSRLLLATLVAAASLAVAVSTAGARRIEFSDQHIRAYWGGFTPTILSDGGGFFIIECVATVEGSFHSRTLSKVSGQLIGYITAAVVPFVCEEGEVAILNGIEPVHTGTVSPNRLPWHIRFDSFTGVLPRITGIRIQIIDASILLWNAFAGCLYRSTSARPLYAILEVVEGRIVDMRWNEAFNIPLAVTLFGFCPAGGRLSERSESLEAQGMTTRVFVRLVQ